MKSEKPKVLMEVLGTPMLGWVIEAAEETGFDMISVVSGTKREMTEEYVKSLDKGIKTYWQKEQLGTGDAVKCAMDSIEGAESVCVLCGDAPFVDSETLKESYKFHIENQNDVTVITADTDTPRGYGRIIREHGEFKAIREHNDCTPEELEICEVNSGAYWFNADTLKRTLPKLSTKNAAGEFYLTDCVELIHRKGAFKAENEKIVSGANTRGDLLNLNEIARIGVLLGLLEQGVSFCTLDSIVVGKKVKVGCDTMIYPNTVIMGDTVIGKNCHISPNCHIENCKIGDNVILNNVQAYDSVIESNVKIGPFVQLRPGTVIKSGVKIGDFVEIKNSVIGENTSAGHLTYIGDSDVGRGVNFGCGCVTANYDGIDKYRTKIGDNAFIGCNTNLIAPVEIGENATTAAGSTITRNVPADALAVERDKMRVIEKWDKNFKRKKKWTGE